MAEAHARSRDYAKTVEVLQGIRADAPQWLPNQRYARDIFSRVIERRRTLTPEMRDLANALGSPRDLERQPSLSAENWSTTR
ncbi:hypothetical protein [Streptomyces sp. NPDC102462]|uniref:hypothetical protein n=1 Tax=Streptomyces sp. NPDC102462 TaxID=3366178 RepID=UPI003821B199